MRPIHLVQLDKTRPALILTRDVVRPYRHWVTVAPIKTKVLDISTEVPLDPARNGVDHPCVIDCDSILTVHRAAIGRMIGRLLPHQEAQLTAAIAAAFDLADK